MIKMNRWTGHGGDDAVSPVVGVMLMLVVTIIIAAVVSGYAGGLISGNNQKAPSLTMDVKIANTGNYVSSGFTATVTSVSEPINTADLKLITSWRATNGVAGGNTSVANGKGAYYFLPKGSTKSFMSPPYGAGPGFGNTPGLKSFNPTKPTADQQFGNFTLLSGTGLYALPYSSTSGMNIGGYPNTGSVDGYGVTTPFTYNGTATANTTDPMQAVLGFGWENLRPGNRVAVSIVHLPSGKVILQKDVTVTDG